MNTNNEHCAFCHEVICGNVYALPECYHIICGNCMDTFKRGKSVPRKCNLCINNLSIQYMIKQMKTENSKQMRSSSVTNRPRGNPSPNRKIARDGNIGQKENISPIRRDNQKERSSPFTKQNNINSERKRKTYSGQKESSHIGNKSSCAITTTSQNPNEERLSIGGNSYRKNTRSGTTEQVPYPLEIESIMRCPFHQEELSGFCLYDKQLCCLECAYNEKVHAKHKIVFIKNAIDILREENKLFKSEAREKLNLIDEALRICNHNKSFLENSEAVYNELIHNEFADLYKTIAKREDEVKKEVKAFFSAKNEEANKNIEIYFELKQWIKKFVENETVKIEKEKVANNYFINTMLKKQFKGLSFAVSPLNNNDISFLSFHSKNNIKSEMEKFGRPIYNKLLKRNNSESKSKFSRSNSVLDNIQQDNDDRDARRGSFNFITDNFEKKSPLLKENFMKGSFIYEKLVTEREEQSRRQPDNLEVLREISLNTECENRSSKTPVFIIGENIKPDLSRGSNERFNYDDSVYVETFSNMEEKKPKLNIHDLPLQMKCWEQKSALSYEVRKNSLEESHNSSIKELANLFKGSSIINRDNKTAELLKVIPKNIIATDLLFSLRKDGANIANFHANCDKNNPYIVFIKTGTCVFGCVIEVSFADCERYFTSENSWIFSYKTSAGIKGFKFPIKKDKKFIAVYMSQTGFCMGSTLANKQDLYINIKEPSACSSVLGYAYNLTDGASPHILAGTYTDWDIQEIEIFNYKE